MMGPNTIPSGLSVNPITNSEPSARKNIVSERSNGGVYASSWQQRFDISLPLITNEIEQDRPVRLAANEFTVFITPRFVGDCPIV